MKITLVTKAETCLFTVENRHIGTYDVIQGRIYVYYDTGDGKWNGDPARLYQISGMSLKSKRDTMETILLTRSNDVVYNYRCNIEKEGAENHFEGHWRPANKEEIKIFYKEYEDHIKDKQTRGTF